MLSSSSSETSGSFVLAPPLALRVRSKIVIPPIAPPLVRANQRWRKSVIAPKTNQSNESLAAATNDASTEDAEAKAVTWEDTPPWLISTTLHVIFLVVLALITTATTDFDSIALTIQQGNSVSTTGLSVFSIEPIAFESDSLSIEEFTDSSTPLAVFVQPIIESPLALISRSTSDTSSILNAVSEAQAGDASKAADAMFSGRTGKTKAALLEKYGGTQTTEDAVAMGLAWLARQQRRDGSWSMVGPYRDGGGGENRTAATSMAMLAFMGAGHTHHSGEYSPQLSRAVKWLVKQQDRNGLMAHDGRDHEMMYSQGQATIALCELYGMTGDSWLRPRAQLALDFACKAQSPEGGWRYQPRFDSDTSVTGWFVMALKSGLAAKLDIDSGAFYAVNRYLNSVQSFDGAAYVYHLHDAASPSMTAEGLLCRQYLGWERNVPAMTFGLETLVQSHPINLSERDVYYWYYATQVLHHYGGPLWDQWNDRMKVDVPAIQEKRGPERGSWAPQSDAWGNNAGRLYTTCFSLYCLEVYYRHMPLYSGPNLE